jgi:hypothetical protein
MKDKNKILRILYVRTKVDGMLKEGIIWKLKFTWTAPILLVNKPNKKVRFCVNYRKSNEITKKNVYSLPRIDDTLDRLARKNIILQLIWLIDISKLK